MSELNPVELLIDYLKSSDIVLEVLPSKEELVSISYAEIQVQTDGSCYVIPVFDEFKDVQLDNPILWFHLVVEACEYFEDVEQYDAWRLDVGLNDEEIVSEIYQHLKRTVPLLRQHIGISVKAISDYDFQLNTGITQKLRACTRADLSN